MDVPTFLPQQDCPGKVRDLLRRARRVVHLPATVAGKTGLANGVVTNLSEAGCGLHLLTSFHPSHHLTVKIYPQDGTTAWLITLAKIRWSKRGLIGLEFLSLPQKDKAKLQQLCGRSRTPLA
jgi:hypothetical protein